MTSSKCRPLPLENVKGFLKILRLFFNKTFCRNFASSLKLHSNYPKDNEIVFEFYLSRISSVGCARCLSCIVK